MDILKLLFPFTENNLLEFEFSLTNSIPNYKKLEVKGFISNPFSSTAQQRPSKHDVYAIGLRPCHLPTVILHLRYIYRTDTLIFHMIVYKGDL